MRYIDFNNDITKQSIVDIEPNQYLGHVSSVTLDDNKTIIIAYPKSHGRGTIILKKSTDAGVTWSNRLETPESWHTSLQVPTLFKTKDACGNALLHMFTGLYPIRHSISYDLGNTWSELSPIGDFGGNVSFSDMIHLDNSLYMGVFHDDGRFIAGGNYGKFYVVKKLLKNGERKIDVFKQDLCPDGTISAPEFVASCNNNVSVADGYEASETIYESFFGERSTKYKSRIYTTISSDYGLTWSSPQCILSHSDAFIAEPALIKSRDNKSIAMIMRENTRKFNSLVSLSCDNGKTWSQPTQTSSALTGDRHTIKYLSDGRIIACFRDMHPNSNFYGNWVAWIGTYEDIIHGKDGQYKIQLKQNLGGRFGDCAYTGMEVLPDDTVIAITYGHWDKDKSPYILSVRFNPNDF